MSRRFIVKSFFKFSVFNLVLAVWFVAFLSIGLFLLPRWLSKHSSNYRLSQGNLVLTHDFGQLPAGYKFQHIFHVTNDQPKSLEIVGVKSACICAVPNLTNTTIKPNRSIDIPVEVAVGATSRRFSTEILLKIKDSADIRLRIEGQVVQQIPSVLTFGQVKRGDQITKRFEIRPFDGSSIKVHDVKYNNDRFNIEHKVSAIDPRVTEVNVTLKRGANSGYFKEKVVIRTSDSLVPDKTIVIEGEVLGRIVVEPDPIVLKLVSDNHTSACQTMTIHAPYGDKLEFQSASVSPIGWIHIQQSSAQLPSSLITFNICLTDTLNVRIKKGIVDFKIRIGDELIDQQVEVYAIRQSQQ